MVLAIRARFLHSAWKQIPASPATPCTKKAAWFNQAAFHMAGFN